MKVLIVGDSISKNIAEGLAKDDRIQVVDGGTVNCTITGGIIRGYNGKHLYSGCPKWRDDWAKLVRDNKPQVVVMILGPWEIVDRWLSGNTKVPPLQITDPQFKSTFLGALDEAAGILSAGGAKVAELTSMQIDPKHPFPESGPLANIWWEPNSETPPQGWVPPKPETPYLSAHAKTDALNSYYQEFAAKGSTTLLDLNKLMCPGDKYHNKLKGKVIRYVDRIHLSRAGQKRVRKWMVPLLLQLASGQPVTQT